jgi:hypothetical protein
MALVAEEQAFAGSPALTGTGDSGRGSEAREMST